MLWGSWRKNGENRAGKRVPGKSPGRTAPSLAPAGFREGLLHTKELPAKAFCCSPSAFQQDFHPRPSQNLQPHEIHSPLQSGQFLTPES